MGAAFGARRERLHRVPSNRLGQEVGRATIPPNGADPLDLTLRISNALKYNNCYIIVCHLVSVFLLFQSARHALVPLAVVCAPERERAGNNKSQSPCQMHAKPSGQQSTYVVSDNCSRCYCVCTPQPHNVKFLLSPFLFYSGFPRLLNRHRRSSPLYY